MTSISSINPFSSMNPNNQTGSIDNAMGRDAFLRMLLVQLQHQDPMNPADSQEFASQLAQFSQLEELQNMGQSLDSSLSADMLLTQSITNTLAASLIGKNVVASTASSYLTNGNADFHFHLEDTASQVTINIYNESGTLVKTDTISNLSSGDHSYSWNGHDQSGNSCADGVYTFTVSAVNAAGNSVTASPFVEGRITGVRYENGMAVLLIGDLTINLSDVTEILGETSGTNGGSILPWMPI
jgi:flagellar basal-body rod modification protein FlgD